MGRTIKLILYYFAYQLAAAIPGVVIFHVREYIKTGTLDIHQSMPLSFALIISIVATGLMAWHLIHFNYVKLNKETLSSLPGKATCLYIIMGTAAIVWMNWLSEMVDLPDTTGDLMLRMKDNIFGIISVCVVAPIFEEMFFRGAIEGYLLRKWQNPRWAILVSALVFGLIHGNPAQILFAFLFGLILGELYYRTGSLLPGIILHFINNTLSIILTNIFPQQETLTDIVGNSETVHTIGMLGIGIFCLTITMFRKEVKPIDWHTEDNSNIESTNE